MVVEPGAFSFLAESMEAERFDKVQIAAISSAQADDVALRVRRDSGWYKTMVNTINRLRRNLATRRMGCQKI